MARGTTGAPPGAVAITVAVPFCPEHKLVPQSVPLGANVSEFRMDDALTVTATVVV